MDASQQIELEVISDEHVLVDSFSRIDAEGSLGFEEALRSYRQSVEKACQMKEIFSSTKIRFRKSLHYWEDMRSRLKLEFGQREPDFGHSFETSPFPKSIGGKGGLSPKRTEYGSFNQNSLPNTLRYLEGKFRNG